MKYESIPTVRITLLAIDMEVTNSLDHLEHAIDKSSNIPEIQTEIENVYNTVKGLKSKIQTIDDELAKQLTKLYDELRPT
jgi:hypothetical protein